MANFTGDQFLKIAVSGRKKDGNMRLVQNVEDNGISYPDPTIEEDYLSMNSLRLQNMEDRLLVTDRRVDHALDSSSNIRSCNQQTTATNSSLSALNLSAIQNQQKSDEPTRPQQDSSPHESMEQGNSSQVATSESIRKTQHWYIREASCLYPEKANYESRLQSFRDFNTWPNDSLPPEELAGKDMFYQGVVTVMGEDRKTYDILDQVACYKCGNTLRQWQPDDDPEEEHKKWHPYCFFTKWKEENNS